VVERYEEREPADDDEEAGGKVGPVAEVIKLLRR
jgi:hypothetical protein